MVLATVPAAPPARKNQRATSCPAPISATVPYQRGSRLIRNAFWWVSPAISINAPRSSPSQGPARWEARFADTIALPDDAKMRPRSASVRGGEREIPAVGVQVHGDAVAATLCG